jgi:hypothetical protein
MTSPHPENNFHENWGHALKEIKMSEKGRNLRVDCYRPHHSKRFIWTPPDVQELLGVMTDRLGCRFISGLFCRPKPAGPDGFR